MCIICAKAKGVDMPSKETITNMWNRNPDGAGFMYAVNGKVKIRKGFMTLDRLFESLEEAEKETSLKETGVVLHFRITTHGGTRPENTHPFAITDSIKRLQMTSVSTDIGVAHNGIISNTPRSKNISDTMEYIASVLAPLKRSNPSFYRDNNLLDLIQNTIDGSRMCFLNGEGDIVTVGTWVENDGLKYSNSSYTGNTYRHYTSYSWSYDDEYDDYPWYTSSTKTKTTTKSKTSKKSGKKKKASTTKTLTVLKKKPIMFIGMATDDAYVTDENNSLMEGDDFGIDSNCKVYAYDSKTDAFVYCEGYRAWYGEGKALPFSHKDAYTEVVIDFND